VLLSVVASGTNGSEGSRDELKHGPTFAEEAAALRKEAEAAFADERWGEAAEAYGRMVGHLLKGGYSETGEAIAELHLKIALAFKNDGDFTAARTMLLHLAESAPDYEVTRREALMLEVETAMGLLPVPPPVTEAPPVEEPRIEGPIRVGGDVTRPIMVTGYTPEYTPIARRARIQGVVILEAAIDKLGNVTDARVLKPLPMGLDQAAIDAVMQWKFTPATLRGQPVAVYYNLTVSFRLD